MSIAALDMMLAFTVGMLVGMLVGSIFYLIERQNRVRYEIMVDQAIAQLNAGGDHAET